MKRLRFALLLACGLAPFSHAAAPNFVVILGEGAGWTSSSVQMDDRNPASRGSVKTPNLERLAAAGMRFSDGYAASPRCTPSRAALFTGRSPAALHMTFVGDGRRDEAVLARVLAPHAVLELPESETTLAELLQRAGYATAHFGKWHVGRASPAKHGFDEHDGANNNGGPDNVASPNPKQALAITAQGIAFLERQAKAGRPFYLQMSHYPNQEEKGRSGGGKQRPPEGNAEAMGITYQTLGQILDAVARLGLTGSTYILYTTDHGTPGRNAPLTGGKGTVLEGGLRVPFLVSGPGVKPGACSHVRVTAMDLLPTFAELAGVKEPLPPRIEGGSFSAVLKNNGVGTVARPREEFVVHFPHYDKDALGPASAILLGDFKLIRVYETGERRLFNLAQDSAERDDLAKQLPAKVAELDQRLTAYLTAVGAQMPDINPAVPIGQRPPDKKGGKGKEKQ
ncbi:MAG: sulfatase [Proteobacteria bacterium]|nr:sulfatase [Pseudomonadota bacterium]